MDEIIITRIKTLYHQARVEAWNFDPDDYLWILGLDIVDRLVAIGQLDIHCCNNDFIRTLCGIEVRITTTDYNEISLYKKIKVY